MYKRKSKSLAKVAPLASKKSSDEETIENIQNFVSAPLNETTNTMSQSSSSRDGDNFVSAPLNETTNMTSQSSSSRDGASKAKKSKIVTKPHMKPFATKYFEETILNAGLKLGEESEDHTLSCEPLTFLSKLKSILTNNVDFPRNAKEFVKGFQNLTKEPEDLKKFLITNVTYIAEDDSDHRVVQECVLKLFLNVSCLQEEILEYFWERATEFAIDDNSSWVSMLLRSIVSLDNVVHDIKIVNGLIELMDVAGHSSRLEIIACLPDIVSHMPHETIVLELIKYLNEDQDLTPAILECLTYLCLPTYLKQQVHVQMLSVLKSSSSPNFFPNLTQFFLFGSNAECNMEVVRGLRDGLDWTLVGNQVNMDISSSQTMTVMVLKNAFTKSKSLPGNWLKLINEVKSAQGHKPLDLIVLLITYSTSVNNKKIVEGVFRNRINETLFTVDLLDNLFNNFRPVLKDLSKEMLDLAKFLVKLKDEPIVFEFASNWFMLLFNRLKDLQKSIISELLVRNYPESDESFVSSLSVLSRIAAEDMELLKPYSMEIYTLADKLENLSMDGLHYVMDLLAGLAFGIKNSVLNNDIHIMIKKQLNSSNLNIKIRGIIRAIMAVKHMVCMEKNSPEFIEEISYSELDNLPDGPSKEAATLIEMIFESTADFPEVGCLFYDELAHIIANSENIEGKFLSWLSINLTKNLTDVFIIEIDESVPKSISGVRTSVQYCLNAPDETEEKDIAVNIAKHCLEDTDEMLHIKLLPALLHLTHIVYMKQHNGDLSDIDAVLGCGVLMPVIDEDNSLDFLCPNFIPRVLDCYAYCINWFRELINAFSLQKQPYLRKRVIQRFNTVLCLEKQLLEFKKNYENLNYSLPLCFYEPGMAKYLKSRDKAKKQAHKSKKKSKKNMDVSNTSLIPDTSKTQTEPTQECSPKSRGHQRKYENCFRTFNLQVLALFEEDLIIHDEFEGQLSVANCNFNMSILLLILYEIYPKMMRLLPYNGKDNTPKKKNSLVQLTMKQEDALDLFISILPQSCCFMETLANFFRKILDENNGIRDCAPIYKTENNNAHISLSNLFSFVGGIFSWTGFQCSKNSEKLKKALKCLATRRDSEFSKSTIKDLVTEACNYVVQYKDVSLLVTTAVNLISLYKALKMNYEDKNILKQHMLLALEMLSYAWLNPFGSPEKGLIYNQNIIVLLAHYFHKPRINMIKFLASDLREQVPLLMEKNGVLQNFKCINKSNFPLMFRSAMAAVHAATKFEIDQGMTDRQHLELWKKVADILKDFTEILKIQENRSNLLAFLKKSIPLFKLFLAQGMPMMELRLKYDTDEVVEILKSLQHTTRFLHSVHCHSLIKKDTAFATYAPHIKSILETMIHNVKYALFVNDCKDVLRTGNLRKRNIQGELIPSQSSSQNDEDEDEIPEDDDSLSVDMEDVSDAGSKSVSNMF